MYLENNLIGGPKVFAIRLILNITPHSAKHLSLKIKMLPTAIHALTQNIFTKRESKY